VNGNVIPLYGHNTVAPAFAHNSEAELHLMYELAIEHCNARHDMNDLIDDYDELKTRWYVNPAFTMTCDAVIHSWELGDLSQNSSILIRAINLPSPVLRIMVQRGPILRF
jgi:hypothetical protein